MLTSGKQEEQFNDACYLSHRHKQKLVTIGCKFGHEMVISEIVVGCHFLPEVKRSNGMRVEAQPYVFIEKLPCTLPLRRI